MVSCSTQDCETVWTILVASVQDMLSYAALGHFIVLDVDPLWYMLLNTILKTTYSHAYVLRLARTTSISVNDI